MALELASGARETCTASGNDFTLTGATSGAIDWLAAITKTALTVDGSTVYAYAFESADPSTYEVMEMTYNSASNKLVRVSTNHGSNGASAVTFDTNTSAVIIYRVLTEFDITPRDIRRLQKVRKTTSDLGTLTTDHATTTYVAGHTTSVTVIPSESGSVLDVDFFGRYRTEANASSSSSRSNLRLYYKNSAGTWTGFGDAMLVGEFSDAASDANAGFDGVFYHSVELDDTQQNASGNWEVKIYVAIQDADTNVTLVSGNFKCVEEKY